MTADFGPARVDEYPDALLTPARFRPYRQRIKRRVRRSVGRVIEGFPAHQSQHVGAVYVGGHLVPESQRDPFLDVAPADPLRLRRRPNIAEHLTGTWLYGGQWMGLFGHFLLESLSALWPEPDGRVGGIVFHAWPSDHYAVPPLPWQQWMVDQAGWDVPLHLVTDHAVTVEHLLLPTRAYRLHRGALPEAVEVWDRIAARREPEGPLFLSRSRLEHDPRRAAGDHLLDQAFADAGCRVVHPEELHIAEQIDAVARANTIIGVGGSQMHLSMFARSCSAVVEIGDLRLPNYPIHDQVCIAEARGHRHRFVPLLGTDGNRDVDATVQQAMLPGT